MLCNNYKTINLNCFPTIVLLVLGDYIFSFGFQIIYLKSVEQAKIGTHISSYSVLAKIIPLDAATGKAEETDRQTVGSTNRIYKGI